MINIIQTLMLEKLLKKTQLDSETESENKDIILLNKK